MKSFWNKIVRKIIKYRLQPIRVFCFHQVSEQLDTTNSWECDWMHTDVFKQKILQLKDQGYTFISLQEAYDKLVNDTYRKEKYAVLTEDDANNCILDLMPWLAVQNIPITLFIPYAFVTKENTAHKCGISLTEEQLKELLSKYPSLITIGNHGYNHTQVIGMSVGDFLTDIDTAETQLSVYSGKVPFFAYPGGRHTATSDMLLHRAGLIPVYCDGNVNCNNVDVIHREIL